MPDKTEYLEHGSWDERQRIRIAKAAQLVVIFKYLTLAIVGVMFLSAFVSVYLAIGIGLFAGVLAFAWLIFFFDLRYQEWTYRRKLLEDSKIDKKQHEFIK